jgi:type I restriction enzyme M protein
MTLLLANTLSKEDNLLKRFSEIHHHIYANDGLSTQQALEEFVKVLFLKIYCENTHSTYFQINNDEWNALKQTGSLPIFTDRISVLFEQTQTNYPEIFEVDDKIRLSPIALGFAVHKLQNISLLTSSQDAKGLAFQKFLAHAEKDGRGQFFTPEPIIDFCVQMLRPQPHETVADPACGSGGFLVATLHFLQKSMPQQLNNSLIPQLFGFDINKSIARLAKMKLILENNTSSNIRCTNSLDNFTQLILPLQTEQIFEGFDVILTNPPFGTIGKITNQSQLSQYDLGYKWVKSGNSFVKTNHLANGQTVEILFIERCLQLLKEGGRMAMVLPNGIFENPSLEYLRYYIKLKTKILSIINLPQETFIPFGTGVKTSLLFVQKDTPNKPTVYPVFFGKIKKLGYQGNKNGTPLYQKNDVGHAIYNANGEPMLDEDFSTTVQEYHQFLAGQSINTDNCFALNYDELNGRFDYDFYAPENRQLRNNLVDKKAVRLGDVVEIVKTKSKKLTQKETIVEYVELSDINTYAFEIINSTQYAVHELPSRASYDLQNEDIITAIAGNSVGTRKHATALVTKGFEGCICTNGFRVLRNPKIDLYFLLFYLKSDLFLQQMMMFHTGAAIPNVSDNDLSNILIYLPDDEKIQEISQKVRHAFELRTASKTVLEGITLH